MDPTVSNQVAQKKILLVEDEESIRDLYTRQLTHDGFIVKAAANGKGGLDLLKAELFDVLLLDIMLPDMNRLEILRQIKADNLHPEMKTIMLTNLGQEDLIKQAFSMGTQGYLIKSSYTPEQISAEVKNLFKM